MMVSNAHIFRNVALRRVWRIFIYHHNCSFLRIVKICYVFHYFRRPCARKHTVRCVARAEAILEYVLNQRNNLPILISQRTAPGRCIKIYSEFSELYTRRYCTARPGRSVGCYSLNCVQIAPYRAARQHDSRREFQRIAPHCQLSISKNNHKFRGVSPELNSEPPISRNRNRPPCR